MMRNKIIILIILSLFTLMSCSSGSTQRKPSSIKIGKEPNLEQVQQLRIQQQIQNLFDLRLISYQTLEKFDQYLDLNPGSLISNPHYKDLLNLRISIDQNVDELSSLHNKLADQILNPELSSDQQASALRQLKMFIPERKHWRGIGKWALEELHATNQNLINNISNNQSADVVSFKNALIKSYEGFESYPIEKEWKIQWKIETLIRKTNSDFQQLQVSSKSTPIEISPSIHGDGNIDGSEYPPHVWSLTFDDGPRGKTSPLILANLKAQKLQATFFQLAQNVKANTPVAHQIRDAGMEIGSHSYDHPDMTKLSYGDQKYQIQTASDIISQIQERPITLYRLPYGSGLRNTQIRDLIAEAQMVHVYWNVDTLDWLNQDSATIAQRAIKQIQANAKDAGVILFHDIHERTIDASLQVMKYLKKNKNRVCRVGDVVNEINRGIPCL